MEAGLTTGLGQTVRLQTCCLSSPPTLSAPTRRCPSLIVTTYVPGVLCVCPYVCVVVAARPPMLLLCPLISAASVLLPQCCVQSG